MSKFTWEVTDLYAGVTGMPFDRTGTFATQYATQRDTATTGGTNDWVVDQGLSKNSCTSTMCTWTCTVYRPLDTKDKLDIKFEVGKTYYASAGYKEFATSAAATSSAKGVSLAPY